MLDALDEAYQNGSLQLQQPIDCLMYIGYSQHSQCSNVPFSLKLFLEARAAKSDNTYVKRSFIFLFYFFACCTF